MNRKQLIGILSIGLTISQVLSKFPMLMILQKIIFHLLKEEVLIQLLIHHMISRGLTVLCIHLQTVKKMSLQISLFKNRLMFQVCSCWMTSHVFLIFLYMMNMMMIMRLNSQNNQLHVLYQKIFLFSNVIREINLHITVTNKNMNKVLNQLKESIYLYAFLRLNY